MVGQLLMGNYGIGELRAFMLVGTLLPSSVGTSFLESRSRGQYSGTERGRCTTSTVSIIPLRSGILAESQEHGPSYSL